MLFIPLLSLMFWGTLSISYKVGVFLPSVLLLEGGIPWTLQAIVCE